MAKMQTDPVTPELLAAVLPWWPLRHEGEMPADVLPPCGIVASDETGPLAAMWMYEPVGTSIRILDWLVTRPGLSPAHARRAILACLAELEAIARDCGATRLFCAVSRDHLALEAMVAGYHFVSNVQHLAKSLE